MRGILTSLALLLSAALALAGPPEAVAAAYEDARHLPRHDTVYQRYLWDPTTAVDNRLVQKFHWNLLSLEGYPGEVRRVSPELLAIDLRDFALDQRAHVWEVFAHHDFVFHSRVKLLKDRDILSYWPGGYDRREGDSFKRGSYTTHHKAGDVIDVAAPWIDGDVIDPLRALTYSEAPIVFAPWALVQSARQLSLRNVEEGDGYYDFLGIKSRQDFFDLVGLDEKKAYKLMQTWRELVQRSGVSQQSRQVVVYGAITGPVFGTLDTFNQAGAGQPKRNLRGGEFLHDAEEWYGFNPQGLPITPATDAGGVLQASVPDKIGGNNAPLNVGNDLRIHPNLGCLQCHAWKEKHGWLKPVDGWARRHFREGGPFKLQDPDRYTFLELRREYLGEFDQVLADGRIRFARAVTRLTTCTDHPRGLSVYEISQLYGKAWNDYVEEPVTLTQAALELGVTKKVLLDKLVLWNKVKGGSDLVLSEFLDGGTLTRLEWEDSYAYAQALVRGLYPMDEIKKVGVLK